MELGLLSMIIGPAGTLVVLSLLIWAGWHLLTTVAVPAFQAQQAELRADAREREAQRRAEYLEARADHKEDMLRIVSEMKEDRTALTAGLLQLGAGLAKVEDTVEQIIARLPPK